MPAATKISPGRPSLDLKRLPLLYAYGRAYPFLLSMLLGPFAPGFVLNGKQARRNPNYPGARNLALLTALSSVYCALLFLLPVPYYLLIFSHLGLSVFSGFRLSRYDLGGFRSSTDKRSGKDTKAPVFESQMPFGHSLLSLALAVYPPVYFWALLRKLGEMASFSVHLPSAVFTEALLATLWVTPLLILGAVWIHFTGFRFGLRQLLFFYAAFPVLLLWMILWERIDLAWLEFLGMTSREPLLFDFAAELKYREWTQLWFYGWGALLGVAYLVRSPKSGVFLRRAMALGLPILIVYVNLSFYSGEWNRYLGGIGNLLGEHKAYGVKASIQRLQLARTPMAYHAPTWEKDLLERDYQAGRLEEAKNRLESLIKRASRKGYHGEIHFEAERMLRNWNAAGSEEKGAADSSSLLELPVIRKADYLDENWYGLLSAMAYLNPAEDDLRLKTHLLEISTTVHISLPDISTLPALAPVLRQLSVPYSPAFLDGERLRKALAAGSVPFLYLHGHWVALCGYDPLRGGYYYLDYEKSRTRTSMLWGESDDLFSPLRNGEGGNHASRMSADAGESGLRRFALAEDLEGYLHEIGGVGVILGDSAFADAREKHAAFLVELGDLRYQQYVDYPNAARNYGEAYALFPNEYIASRMLFLRNLYRQNHGDPRNYATLFAERGRPAWFEYVRMDAATDSLLTDKMNRGLLGRYLLMGWSPMGAGPSTLDERMYRDSLQLKAYQVLSERNPHEALFVDSLAGLHMRLENWEAAENSLRRLREMLPGIHSYAAYRLAWTLFKAGNFPELEAALAESRGFENEARYLTMAGALALHRERPKSARPLLEKSLKLDKGMPETHAMLAELARNRKDTAAAELHERWLTRTSRPAL